MHHFASGLGDIKDCAKDCGVDTQHTGHAVLTWFCFKQMLIFYSFSPLAWPVESGNLAVHTPAYFPSFFHPQGAAGLAGANIFLRATLKIKTSSLD